MKLDKKDLLLYAVTDRSWLNGETLYSQVEKALTGGATFIQLREKDLDSEAFLQEAKELKKLCKEYKIAITKPINYAFSMYFNFVMNKTSFCLKCY